jgi:DNA-3-methyladenine glycosylase
MSARLMRDFFNPPTLQVARDVLGKRLVRVVDGVRLAGFITEVEAYRGEEDLGCHARAGRTRRTQVMYGPPGYAYVYFTYGMHWMLNFVTEAEGFPAALLVRAVQPSEGLAQLGERRAGRPPAHWTDGPAKLCQAFQLDGRQNGLDLCGQQQMLFLEDGEPVPDECVTNAPRVGLYTVPEPWKSIPWRFCIKEWRQR